MLNCIGHKRMKYFLVIDQGTSSTRAILFDENFCLVEVSQTEFKQFFPKDGWVEHDANEIFDTVIHCINDVMKKSGTTHNEIISIGITNQRETCLLWDKDGTPYSKAIVWQDRRTAEVCNNLKQQGLEGEINQLTGLLADPYFSGTKLSWMLEKAGKRKDLFMGTIDTFLIWKLTEGKSYFMDATNASRTLLMDIRNISWSDDMCNLLNIPIEKLPEIKNSADDFGETSLFGGKIKISGVAGDQQAALFGQGCFEEGEAKSTYGTGCFMMLNTGSKIKLSKSNLLTTVGYRIGGKVTYALEGSIFMAGASVQWLRDNLGFFNTAPEIESSARKSNKKANVFFIPAFTGLGAPYWDPEARGAIFGLSRETSKDDISQALLEAITFQTKDVFDCMSLDGVDLKSLKIDGGMVENRYFNQILADTLNLKILLPDNKEATAKGAAFLASLGSKHTNSPEDLNKFVGSYDQFDPLESKEKKYKSWKYLVSKILTE